MNWKSLSAILCALVLAPAVLAGDAKFEGEITGLVCASCQEHVTGVLMKIDGVKNVEIVATNKPEIRHIIITSSKEAFTAEDANKALLAAHADSYKVTRLEKKS